MEILNKIQTKLKAPKGQTNSFGKYKYRSCEDILEAVKPLLGEATLTVWDEIVLVGDRFYVKATASLQSGEERAETSAFAREAEEKKGMDVAQVTGAASSYARKYALNGLFCIDDNKDPDTQDNSAPVHKWAKGEKEAITTQVLGCLETGDEMGLKQILDEYSDPEEKIKIWGLFTSTQRSTIKQLLAA